MRGTVRFIITIFLLVVLILLGQHLDGLWDRYNVPAYLGIGTHYRGNATFRAPLSKGVGDKVIVMAKLTRENTDWVAENLPE